MNSATRYLPAGAMGKAIGYALANWAAMAPGLEGGRIEPERSGDSPANTPNLAGANRQ